MRVHPEMVDASSRSDGASATSEGVGEERVELLVANFSSSLNLASLLIASQHDSTK